ncbi:hypothetical protein A8F94_15275 [Bacillus sp. FJAT-27225]|uniref:hypothetical protein n=1 Tax=Bacillus sp. FJAT-27225 TaxID=1743144 RepID=UPI00080C2844|nr:hypothetical protein [Bacillus sp. FJAT-27225]OCA84086.1 hypothetical protein A8F94_15275 [Bacillus sp. FJAT-27225]
MKKYKVQIISAAITMVFLSIVTIGFIYFFGVKDSYQLSSGIAISNTNGIIDGYKIDYEDCKNEDGNFQLKIEVGSKEAREIDFELSTLVNYEQQYFRRAESENKVLSSVLSVNQNKREIIIILDKDAFELFQNQLVINIRQDIKQLSYKNKLVRDSNTINFTYYVSNEDGKNQSNKQDNTITNIIETPLEDTSQNVVFDIETANGDDPLIKTKKNEDISINLNVGGNETRQYIIWAYLDSKQAKINGNPYGTIEINKNTIGITNLNIENTVQPGIYELEIYCVPSPYEEISEELKEVISGKRYTVKVE